MKLIIDRKEIGLHIRKILVEMQQQGADAVLISSNANIYYTSGRYFRGFFYLPLDGKPLWFIMKPQIFENEEDLIEIRKPEQIPSILEEIGYKIPEKIALENDDLSFSEIIRLRNLFPNAEFHNASQVLKRARMVKTEWEINEMKKDGRHHSKVYGEISDCYKPGMSDLRLQIEIERR